MPLALGVAWWYSRDAPVALVGVWPQFGFKF